MHAARLFAYITGHDQAAAAAAGVELPMNRFPLESI